MLKRGEILGLAIYEESIRDAFGKVLFGLYEQPAEEFSRKGGKLGSQIPEVQYVPVLGLFLSVLPIKGFLTIYQFLKILRSWHPGRSIMFMVWSNPILIGM